MNLPASFLSESIKAFCEGVSSRKRAIFSTSSGGMLRQTYHSIILSMGSAAFGRSSEVLSGEPVEAPSFRHIFVIFTTYGANSGFFVII